ncbi:MAG: DUF721 domain-containing protein [Actinomycetota bacterium]|nr:DUF721 domain-containing protein [Actinomycetota bacterium]
MNRSFQRERGVHRIEDSIRVIKTFIDSDDLAAANLSVEWSTFVDRNIAEHSKPIGGKGNYLIVCVDSPSARTYLKMQSRQILKRLNDAGYGYSELKVTQGRL